MAQTNLDAPGIAARRAQSALGAVLIAVAVFVSSSCVEATPEVQAVGPDGQTLALPSVAADADSTEASGQSGGDGASGQDGGQAGGQDRASGQDGASGPEELPDTVSVADIECSAADTTDRTALTTQGVPLLDRHVASGAALPSYDLAVAVDPAIGAVAGAMRAAVPNPGSELHFRVFAGMEAFDSGLQIRNVTVDGQPIAHRVDRALLTVPVPADADGSQELVVELEFAFTIDQMAANGDLFAGLSGESLQPDQVGLLGRTESGMQLGHWFPVWLPVGVGIDPDPSGFGDIGAFPAATICATITVPDGYQVVTGGSRIAEDGTSVVEAGAGLRDFSMLISNDLEMAARFVGDVQVRVWGPRGDPESLQTVLDYADISLVTLTEAFGPYPWTELDVISAPLGAGVGGMEWPGAVWIEQSMFAGGLPGMGDLGGLGDLFGDDAFGSLLGEIGGPALTTSLEWTVAHELGHEWWHATVGNDSIESPAVDEPLAQFSACLAMERIHPENWREICDAQTIGQYAQARALGVPDAPAEQPTDSFESALQYGAVVYGKAPGFYFAAADLIGWQELTDALAGFVVDNSFALVSTDALRAHLVDAAGDDGGGIAELWDRWFRQARGDEDIDISSPLGAVGGLEGFDGLFGEDFDPTTLFGEDFDPESLFGEDFDPEALFGEDFDPTTLFGEDFDPESLFGEDGDLFGQLLEDLLESSGSDG